MTACLLYFVTRVDSVTLPTYVRLAKISLTRKTLYNKFSLTTHLITDSTNVAHDTT